MSKADEEKRSEDVEAEHDLELPVEDADQIRGGDGTGWDLDANKKL